MSTPPQVPTPTEPIVPAAPPPLPEGIQAMETREGGDLYIKLATGEEYTGKPDAVIAKLAKSKVDTNTSYNGIKGELEQIRQQITPQQQPRILTPQEQEAANLQTYLANETAKGLGFESSDELKEFIAQTGRVTSTSQVQNTTMQFQVMCPDFPQTEEASAALIETATKYGIIQPNTPDDRITPFQLVAAHSLALREGRYQPLAQQNQQQQQPQPRIAPMMPGTQPENNGVQTNGLDPWRVPLKDAESVLRNAGMLKK